MEQNRKGKWLTQTKGKNEATVLRWRLNSIQPSLEILEVIASA